MKEKEDPRAKVRWGRAQSKRRKLRNLGYHLRGLYTVKVMAKQLMVSDFVHLSEQTTIKKVSQLAFC